MDVLEQQGRLQFEQQDPQKAVDGHTINGKKRSWLVNKRKGEENTRDRRKPSQNWITRLDRSRLAPPQ
jgi:hypothetical protein